MKTSVGPSMGSDSVLASDEMKLAKVLNQKFVQVFTEKNVQDIKQPIQILY